MLSNEVTKDQTLKACSDKNMITALISLLEKYQKDQEIMMQINKVLLKLTRESEVFAKELAENDLIKKFIKETKFYLKLVYTGSQEYKTICNENLKILIIFANIEEISMKIIENGGVNLCFYILKNEINEKDKFLVVSPTENFENLLKRDLSNKNEKNEESLSYFAIKLLHLISLKKNQEKEFNTPENIEIIFQHLKFGYSLKISFILFELIKEFFPKGHKFNVKQLIDCIFSILNYYFMEKTLENICEDIINLVEENDILTDYGIEEEEFLKEIDNMNENNKEEENELIMKNLLIANFMVKKNIKGLENIHETLIKKNLEMMEIAVSNNLILLLSFLIYFFRLIKNLKVEIVNIIDNSDIFKRIIQEIFLNKYLLKPENDHIINISLKILNSYYKDFEEKNIFVRNLADSETGIVIIEDQEKIFDKKMLFVLAEDSLGILKTIIEIVDVQNIDETSFSIETIQEVVIFLKKIVENSKKILDIFIQNQGILRAISLWELLIKLFDIECYQNKECLQKIEILISAVAKKKENILFEITKSQFIKKTADNLFDWTKKPKDVKSN